MTRLDYTRMKRNRRDGYVEQQVYNWHPRATHFTARCQECGEQVSPGPALMRMVGMRWQVAHRECFG